MQPDTKDWTWVLQRPCPDCGFDAGDCPPASVAGLVRGNARAWSDLAAAGSIRSGRHQPDALRPERWSSLEYACHVRDVYRRYADRIELMVAEDDPLFANWDQDASAEEEAYDAQDPSAVVADLVAAGDRVAALLERLTPDQWQRSGRRSDGAAFTVDSLSRYMVHDPIHHLWDVTSG